MVEGIENKHFTSELHGSFAPTWAWKKTASFARYGNGYHIFFLILAFKQVNYLSWFNSLAHHPYWSP